MFPLRVWPTVGHHSHSDGPTPRSKEVYKLDSRRGHRGCAGWWGDSGSRCGGDEYKITYFMEFSKNE